MEMEMINDSQILNTQEAQCHHLRILVSARGLGRMVHMAGGD